MFIVFRNKSFLINYEFISISPTESMLTIDCHYFKGGGFSLLRFLKQLHVLLADRRFDSNYDALLDKAGVCGLANRRIQNMMICIFKCLHFGKYPCYLKQLIKLRSTAYSLRGTNILSLPKPSTTTYGLNSFSYSSVKYWNSLPDHFRKTVDYSEFKRKLLVHGFS